MEEEGPNVVFGRSEQHSEDEIIDKMPYYFIMSNNKMAIAYISGYVAQTAHRRTTCVTCSSALYNTKENLWSDKRLAFFYWKNRDGLTLASEDVFQVCIETERHLTSIFHHITIPFT